MNTGDIERPLRQGPGLLARDVTKTVEALRALLALDAQDHRLPEDVPPEEQVVLRARMEEARSALLSLQAEDVASAMMVGGVQGEASLVLWNHARRALYSLAPIVVMRLAQKMDSDEAPGNVRILSEVAKGLGLLVPGQMMSDKQREVEIAKRSLSELTEAELDAKLTELRGEEV